MIVEKCGGDFCDYVMTERIKMNAHIKKTRNGIMTDDALKDY